MEMNCRCGIPHWLIQTQAPHASDTDFPHKRPPDPQNKAWVAVWWPSCGCGVELICNGRASLSWFRSRAGRQAYKGPPALRGGNTLFVRQLAAETSSTRLSACVRQKATKSNFPALLTDRELVYESNVHPISKARVGGWKLCPLRAWNYYFICRKFIGAASR